MQRYVLRMFADQWRQFSPAVAVVAVATTMIGLCVQQFAWTNDPNFQAAVDAAGVPLAEYQIISVTIYTVIAAVSWVSLTVVGHASVQATNRTYALWLLLGAAPSTVFSSMVRVLAVVSALGGTIGAIVSALLSFALVPAFNAAVSAAVVQPDFPFLPWAPLVTIAVGVVTAMVGGILPARRASRTAPSAALRAVGNRSRRSIVGAVRIACGVLFLLIAVALVAAAKFAVQLGSTGLAPMFNLAINAGGAALVAVYLLCPEIVAMLLWMLHKLFARVGMTVAALGVRAAAARVHVSATTIAPLAAGLGGIGLVLCAVNSVVALTNRLQPGTPTDLTDVWTMVAIVAVSMLATSTAVVALSARGREREIALLQASGMEGRQVSGLIASEAFAMASASSVVAAVPVAASGLVSILVSSAALQGEYVVDWPVGEMLVGLIVSWLVLLLILLVPSVAPLRAGPGAQLRELDG